MTGYDYGNARLRARKSRFLGRSDYHALLGATDLDALLGMLGATRYAHDVEVVLPRLRAIRRLDGAVSHNVGRTLDAVASFYDEEAGRAVALLLERWDLRNVQAILRGVAARIAPPDIAATLVPAGTIPAAVLRGLAAASDLRTLLDMLVSLGVPSPREAASLVAAWPDIARTGDWVGLELAVHRMYLARWRAELEDLDLPALSRLFRRETDRADVLAALRLSALPGDVGSAVVSGDHWLQASLDAGTLAAAASASTAEGTVEILAPRLPGAWAEALRSWAAHGDLAQVAFEIDAAITMETVGLFSAGDPLSIDVPLAFTAMLENEARNLRSVARVVASGLPAAAAFETMAMP